MKRFALVGPAYPFRGGIAQYTSSLFLALSERVEVRLFSYRRLYPGFLFPGRTQFDESSHPLNVASQPVLDPMRPWTWMSAGRAIAAFDPDVVLVMWWNPFFAPMLGVLTRRLRRGRKRAIVFLCHNVFPHEQSLPDRILLRFAFRSATHFLVQSQIEADRLREFCPRAPVEVIFHPAQAFFQEEKRRNPEEARRLLIDRGVLSALGPSGATLTERRLLLFFGHVRRYKGLDVLLRALPRVLQHLQVELLVVGEFYESRAGYDEIIRKSGIESWVRVVDRYVPNEEVAAFFEAADAVVLPYRSGTQSGVVPLAYQFERPVLVTRIGGVPEAVEEGRTGLLVNPEDPEDMARAILEFYRINSAGTFAPHLHAAARRMSWEELASRIESFLKSSTG